MASVEMLNTTKSANFGEQQNDVVPMQQSTMATEALAYVSGQPLKCDNNNGGNDTITTVTDSCTSGVAGVSALSLNDKVTTVTVDVDNKFSSNVSIPLDNGKIKGKGKRRRRKTKTKTTGKPYKKSNWKFQSRQSAKIRNNSGTVLSTLAPCNTNKFLMEEHMPEMRRNQRGHNRDSSYSADSEENIFPSMSEDEEFLSKEFSSAYEDVRSERLNGMSRTQLIQEYLQLEANYDKLSKNLAGNQNRSYGYGYDNDEISQQTDTEEVRQFENQKLISKLEERIKELTAENLELRRQMADIRSRRRRSQSSSGPKYGCHNQHHAESHNSSTSEDSESDSSTTTSSSSTSSKSSASSISSLTSNKSHAERNSHSSRSPI